MKTITFEGIITQTSNKQGKDYASENPKKSVYISVDNENAKILEDFGLTKYTSKKDNVDFFVVKASANISRYENDKIVEKINGNGEDDVPNFSSNNNTIGMAIMEGENKGNKFMRLYAINCEAGIVTENEPSSPF